MSDDRRRTPAGARWLGGTAPAASEPGCGGAPERCDSTDELAARVAASLRAEETAAPDFEARLVAAVRAEAAPYGPRATPSAARRRWWVEPRQLRVSPLAGLAVAAGFAAVVSVGTLWVAEERGASRPVAAGAIADTVHVVRFVIAAPTAERVTLVGDFNRWEKDATPMRPTGDGATWTVSLAVPAGRHEYAFVIDGERWVADPAAPLVRDEFGTETAALQVGRAPQGA